MIWIEVLGRGGVEHRARIERLPAVIGRGYASDVLVDDPLVDGSHARLFAADDGALGIEDLGTVNGTLAGGTTLRGTSAPLAPGDVVRIGRTSLRLATSDLAVPPALAATEQDWLELTPRQRGLRVLLPIIGLGLMLLSGWMAETENDLASLASLAVGVVGLAAAWAGAWALGGRLSRQRRAHFADHHALAWTFLIATTAIGWLFGWLDFLTESGALETLGYGVMAGVFVWLVAGHLRYASGLRRPRRLLVALAVTAGLGAIGTLLAQAGNELSGRELTVSATLKPAPPGLVPAGSIETFLSRSGKLKTKLDREESSR